MVSKFVTFYLQRKYIKSEAKKLMGGVAELSSLPVFTCSFLSPSVSAVNCRFYFSTFTLAKKN